MSDADGDDGSLGQSENLRGGKVLRKVNQAGRCLPDERLGECA